MSRLSSFFAAALLLISSAVQADTRAIVNGSSGGGGTVTSVSVAPANGFTGTVANPTTTPALTLGTSITGLLQGNSTAISAAQQFVPCTNGSTGSADTALLATAFAAGGNITLLGNCTVNAPTTVISNTYFNANGYTITSAGSSNWSGSTVVQAFVAAANATNITIENGNFVWTAGAGQHVLAFPSGNSYISVLNNVVSGAYGDATAFVGTTYFTETGNQYYGCTNVCSDHWNGYMYGVSADNIFSTTSTTAAAVCQDWTGFNTSPSVAAGHIKSHHNICFLNGQGAGGQLGFYNQGATAGSCLAGQNNDFLTFDHNEVYIASGVWAEAFRQSGCSNHNLYDHNQVWSDGVTTANLPAFEVNGQSGNGCTDTRMEHNQVNNWVGQTSGSDQGVFTNKCSSGTLEFNSIAGTYNAPIDYVAASTGITQFCDAVVGAAACSVTSPLALNGTLSGTGLTNYFASPPAVGGTAPAAVASTTLTSVPAAAPTRDAGNVPFAVIQGGIPIVAAGSGYMDATGHLVIGSVPSNSATLTFSATSGSVTATFSAATLVGSASDNGRLITVYDSGNTRYTTCTISAFSSTTVATCSLSQALSTTGAYSNASTWLTGMTASNTLNFAAPLRSAYPAAYFSFPAAAPSGVGVFYCVPSSLATALCYNNAYTSGTPTIPGSPTAFSGLTPANFAQSVAIQTLLSQTIPGNTLGINGEADFDVILTESTDSNNKTFTATYGGTTSYVACAIAGTTAGTTRYTASIAAQGDTTHQIAECTSVATNAAQNLQNGSAIIESNSQIVQVRVTLANQYSYCAAEKYTVRVQPN